MTNLRKLVLAALLFLLAAPAQAQEPAGVWNQLEQPVMDETKAAIVENVPIVRDRIHITLVSGTIQFTKGIDALTPGRVTGAAFRGSGRVEVETPNPLEAQQLRFFTGGNSLSVEFTEAAFVFTDEMFQEIAGQVKWGATPDPKLGELLAERLKNGEDAGAEVVPRLFKSLYSADPKRTAFFAAEMKTETRAGWILASYDALQPEEIRVGRWVDVTGGRIFDTWLNFPAGGRASADAFRDPLAREDFHIKNYKINATVTGGAELSATTQVTVEPRVKGERVLLFELDSNLRTTSVRNSQGAELTFFQPRDPKDRNQSYGDYLAVLLPEPAPPGPPMTLEFTYGGKRVVRQVGPGNYFCQSYGWYPTRPNSFAGRADFEINFKSPKKYTLVATGLRQDETTDGDWKVSTWKSEIPLAVAGFAFGDYKVVTEKVGDVDIEVYANQQPDEFMREVREFFDPSLPGQRSNAAGAVGSLTPSEMAKTMRMELANTVKVFQVYFGPYPYKRLAVTNIPYSYGQGWPTLIYLSALSFLDSTQRNSLGIRSHTEITDFFRAHESSHQWWGHRVGWKSYHDQWLSEGFAQFSGNLYVQYRQNEKEYLERIRKDREDILQADPFGNVPEQVGPVWMGLRLSSSRAPRAYGTVVYAKGGLVLHTLRRLMWNSQSKDPDDRFIAMMKEFCDTYNNQAASTEDFKAIAEKHMLRGMDVEGNGRLDWFFRQYVYGTGVPEYTFSYQVTETGDGKWKVSGIVKQANVPDGWMDALPIYLTHSGGKVNRVGLIAVRGKETPFDVILPVKPEKLILNQYEDTLALVKQ